MNAAEFGALGIDELHRALAAGDPIEESALEDVEYHGTSLGLPALVEKLTWKVFRKAFHRDPDTGALRGWNVRLDQTTSQPRMRHGEPHTFGHFLVRSMNGYRMPLRHGKRVSRPSGRMLDYGAGGNGLDPVALLRDPVVAVRVGDPSLLLGWSYLDMGAFRACTPSFFTLERLGPLTHRV